jgi:hypothetical protein
MQCVNCYEKEHGKTLWTFRQNLSYYEKKQEEDEVRDNDKEIESFSNNKLNDSTFNKDEFIKNLKRN